MPHWPALGERVAAVNSARPASIGGRSLSASPICASACSGRAIGPALPSITAWTLPLLLVGLEQLRSRRFVFLSKRDCSRRAAPPGAREMPSKNFVWPSASLSRVATSRKPGGESFLTPTAGTRSLRSRLRNRRDGAGDWSRRPSRTWDPPCPTPASSFFAAHGCRPRSLICSGNDSGSAATSNAFRRTT